MLINNTPGMPKYDPDLIRGDRPISCVWKHNPKWPPAQDWWAHDKMLVAWQVPNAPYFALFLTLEDHNEEIFQKYKYKKEKK